ncbi:MULTISPECIES: hypothetical protein [Citrobacter freundii complex]|uniref:hypothetical protein n=1 Tax=Citrobacter freundii complex TaxID=1344959 RepID=UPI000652513D|nr:MULTISPECIES: hypothetical protein [Citrobacter freundii complex]KLV73479.1 hypothetical protein SK38_01963 [Citrobacter sp. MGH110]MEB1052215.1 hypothetical protein [Citrobacter portucalensis]
MKAKMITISTQIALFFESTIARPDTFYNSINTGLGEIIDSMPQTLPLPKEAPPEIPRVIGNSSFGQYSLNVSLNRVDLLRNYASNEDFDLGTNEFKRICNSFIVNCMQKQKITRIGIVGNFFIHCNNPNKIISELYLNDKNKDNDEISLRLNKKTTIKDVTINNVLNINQGNVSASNYAGEAVLVQLDYNTEPKETPLDEALLFSIFSEKSEAYSHQHAMEKCGL